MSYLWELPSWPSFRWDESSVLETTATVRAKRAELGSQLLKAGIEIQQITSIESLTSEIVGTALIENEVYSREAVRSSVTRRIGLNPWSGPTPNDKRAEDLISVLVDLVRMYREPLTQERILGWHKTLMSHAAGVTPGRWRSGPVDVVSGAFGRERIHFRGPPAERVADEMRRFAAGVGSDATPPLVMSAVAHLWFVTIHPFEDGNGRMARAIGEHFLAQEDDTPMRYYSFSRAVNSSRMDYYRQLELAQANNLDVTPWILWCLNTVKSAMDQSIIDIGLAINRSRLEKLSATVTLNERQRRMFGRLFDEFPEGVSTAKWAAACGCSPDSAVRDIGGLVALGMLKKGPEGGRSTRYLLTVP